MSVRYLAAATAAAPALGNHLWQSTLFLMLAGFLTIFSLVYLRATRSWSTE